MLSQNINDPEGNEILDRAQMLNLAARADGINNANDSGSRGPDQHHETSKESDRLSEDFSEDEKTLKEDPKLQRAWDRLKKETNRLNDSWKKLNEEKGRSREQVYPPSNEQTVVSEKTESILNPNHFHREWHRHWTDLQNEFNELKNNDSGLYKETHSLLQDGTWGNFLRKDPMGIRAATEVAKLRLEANQIPHLQQELEKIRKENSRLTKLTSLHASPPSKTMPSRDFDGMSTDEQRRYLKDLSRQADEQGGFF
jgi:hypothetical protein